MKLLLKSNLVLFIATVLLTSCGELSKKAEEKFNDEINNKAELLDSIVNNKAELLDSIVNKEINKVMALDSATNKKIDSLKNIVN